MGGGEGREKEKGKGKGTVFLWKAIQEHVVSEACSVPRFYAPAMSKSKTQRRAEESVPFITEIKRTMNVQSMFLKF